MSRRIRVAETRGPGPIERGTTELARLMAAGSSLPEIALTASRFGDEFADQAAKSPSERVLVSKVAGMLEHAAYAALKKWRADGRPPPWSPGEYLTAAEFAALMRRTPGTVGHWRATGFGPPSFKLAGRVFYERSEVERWILSQAKRMQS